MKNAAGEIYNFVYRGVLTEESLDRAGRQQRNTNDTDHASVAKLLSLDALPEDHLANARKMATVYSAIAAFENSVRELITKTLLEETGETWWSERVSKNIREQAQKRKEEEEKVRWHTQRGEDPICYTMLPNLLNIIRQNHDYFVAAIPNLEWASSVFDTIEKSRNVIMHSGMLEDRDIARLGITMRDWTAQVAM